MCQSVQHARNAVSRDRALHVDGDRFVGCVIHDHQTLDHPTFHSAVEHEVHRPHLVGLQWPQQWLALAHRHLLAPAAPDLQLLFAVQPLHTLVVHDASFLTKFEIDHPHAIAAMAMRQRKNALA